MTPVLQAIVAIMLVAAIGVSLGKLKLFGVSLGITFVFFTGIIAGHLGVVIEPQILAFAQNLGLILFVYTLGLQVGPGFFSSFKKEGIALNGIATGVVVLGLLLTWMLWKITGLSFPVMMGLMSGAVTNTPALGAAQQTLLQIDPGNTAGVTDMALACAVTYPLGVVGVILVLAVMQKSKRSVGTETPEQKTPKPNVTEYQVINPNVFGKSIREVVQLTDKHFVISRIWRNGTVTIPASETVLQAGDHLLVVSGQADIETISILFGEQENKDWNKEDIDWDAVDRLLVSRKIIVTRPKLDGTKLGSLRLRNLYGINITRVNRSGFDLFPSPGLRLQLGDRLTIVGEATAIDNVSKLVGDEMKDLERPNLFPIFIGIALGVLLGVLPIQIPGLSMPIKLGIAGGPIIVGILVGAFGTRFHVTTYTTHSANLMMRQFGIIIYLAGLGIASGPQFFATVFRMEGLLWIGVGLLLTIVPVIIVCYLTAKFFKLDFAANAGILCGSMANPMALNYANTVVRSDEPSVAYATVYPLSMFLRVITAQVMILCCY
ncbi:MAG: putative transporter [Candidatus Symbiothrix sp.]|jgi:AspT/YidE/YbjL antiporter-like protein|nr:putative transporter [Candidatus Symbiothrix sp.]